MDYLTHLYYLVTQKRYSREKHFVSCSQFTSSIKVYLDITGV